MATLTVRPISAEAHQGFIAEHGASFLQTPAWGRVKTEWRAESIGWWDGDELAGTALVLHRPIPRLKRRSLAYLPEGPVIDWSDPDLDRWLAPMAAYLSRQGAFAVRIGPPVVVRRWDADTIKHGIADESILSLTQLAATTHEPIGAATVSQLRELGWREQGGVGGFAAGQPKYNFWVDLAGKDEAEVLAAMNQLWRRNIRKADRSGVTISVVGGEDVAREAVRTGLAAFHDLYVHTAERDGFTPRPASYFSTMFDALGAEDPDRIRLYLAHHEEDLVAATIMVMVGRHAWYAYGASSTHKREVRGSNAIQWRMMQDARAAGADVYDLRGITDTLATGDPHLGLIQFKVGTGGSAVEYAGEWDLPLNRPLYKAFQFYLGRRR